MLISWLICTTALATPGWKPIGPERGHVLDADANGTTVAVATRVGVLSASLPISEWTRDPRFPLDTRRLALGPGGMAWAAPGGQIWRVTDDDPQQMVTLPSGNIAVDLATTASGALLAAVRGSEPHVLRIQPDSASGTATTVLDGVDPWCLLTQGEQVWVGTIKNGLWYAPGEGQEFEHLIRKGSVSALGRVGGRVLAAFSDGHVVDVADDETVLNLPGAVVTGIADDGGQPLLTLAGQHGAAGPLALLLDGRLVGVDLNSLNTGEGLVRPLGAWSLGKYGALVGTFRQGPLVVAAGQARMARTGFRATVTGGAALDSNGRLLLGLMGTGVYLSKDGGKSFRAEHGGMGPVTDAIGVVAMGEDLVVLDFEGVALLDRSGQWHRSDAVQNPNPGRRNGLEQLVLGPQGAWWGLDTAGQLYQRHQGAWQACKDQGGMQLASDQEHLYLITARGVQNPTSCDEPATPAWDIQTDNANWDQALLAGDWLAAPARLWRAGKNVGTLPTARVTAIAAREDEVLISFATGEILRCDARGCEAAARRLPNELVAIGWLPDGRIWAAETRGTLLVADGDDDVLPWSRQPGGQPLDGQLQRLETPPWTLEGVRDALGPGVAGAPMPGSGPPTAAAPAAGSPGPAGGELLATPAPTASAPTPVDRRWTLLLLLGAAAGAGAWWWKKKRAVSR